MFGVVRVFFAIVVMAAIWFLCKPVQRWVRKRKSSVLVLYAAFLLLLLASGFIVPEATFIGFRSPLAAYAYVKSPGEAEYEQRIDCETSTLFITRKGTNNTSTTLLLKKDGKWYITAPFSLLFENAFDYEMTLHATCIVHPQLNETYWQLFNMDGSGAESVVSLNGKLPEATIETGRFDGKTFVDRIYVLPANTTRIELGIDGEVAAVFEQAAGGWKMCGNQQPATQA